MSKLTDKIFLMRNMNDEEIRNYIKTLTDNEKDLIIYSALKMIISDEFDSAFQNLNKIEEQSTDYSSKKLFRYFSYNITPIVKPTSDIFLISSTILNKLFIFFICIISIFKINNFLY